MLRNLNSEIILEWPFILAFMEWIMEFILGHGVLLCKRTNHDLEINTTHPSKKGIVPQEISFPT